MNTTMCAPMPADAAVARPWRSAVLAGTVMANVTVAAHVHTAAAIFGSKRTARHLGSSPT